MPTKSQAAKAPAKAAAKPAEAPKVAAPDSGETWPEPAVTDYNPDANPVMLQHPSLVGEDDIEIAKRSDTDEESASEFVKSFVVLPNAEDGSLPADEDLFHASNKTAVLNEALQRGLHPTAEVELVGVEDHPEGQNKIVTYSVAVVPAAVDDEPELTVVPSSSVNDLVEEAS